MTIGLRVALAPATSLLGKNIMDYVRFRRPASGTEGLASRLRAAAELAATSNTEYDYFMDSFGGPDALLGVADALDAQAREIADLRALIAKRTGVRE